MFGKQSAVVLIFGIFIASPCVAGISLDQVILDALNEVEKLKNFIDTTSVHLENGIAGVIKGAYAAFDKEAEKLQNAPHLSSCVDGLKANVDSDADALGKDVVLCVTSEVDSALDDVEEVVRSVQSAEQDIGAARAALKACGEISNAAKKAECVVKETAHVTSQEAALAGKVGGAVTDAVKICHNFPSAVSSCEARQLRIAEGDAAELVEKLASCK